MSIKRMSPSKELNRGIFFPAFELIGGRETLLYNNYVEVMKYLDDFVLCLITDKFTCSMSQARTILAGEIANGYGEYTTYLKNHVRIGRRDLDRFSEIITIYQDGVARVNIKVELRVNVDIVDVDGVPWSEFVKKVNEKIEEVKEETAIKIDDRKLNATWV